MKKTIDFMVAELRVIAELLLTCSEEDRQTIISNLRRSQEEEKKLRQMEIKCRINDYQKEIKEKEEAISKLKAELRESENS